MTDENQDQVMIKEVSGEVPSLELLDELKDILRTFGVDDAGFDRIPAPAQVFLVGQYQEIRRCNEAIERLQWRIAELERELCGPDHEPDTRRYARTTSSEIDPSSETRGNPIVDLSS